MLSREIRLLGDPDDALRDEDLRVVEVLLRYGDVVVRNAWCSGDPGTANGLTLRGFGGSTRRTLRGFGGSTHRTLRGFGGSTHRTLRGFGGSTHRHCGPALIRDVGEWLGDGRIQLRVTIFEGLERAAEAMVSALSGRTTGKALVRLP